MTAALADTYFWFGLLEIIGVNILLSGDNAVVIALAARSLPIAQRGRAIVLGSVAAILMRVGLTMVAAEALTLPYLKMIGSVLLLWIGVKLLVPEDGQSGAVGGTGGGIWAAIRTILIADLVMSLDNVLAVAAAAKGNIVLLVLGLVISIPLIVFGSTLILRIMDRFPVVITLGAALLGYVAGEMLMSEQTLEPLLPADKGLWHFALPFACALLVAVLGKWLASRAIREPERQAVDLAGEDPK